MPTKRTHRHRETTIAASLVIDFVAYVERQGHSAKTLRDATGLDAAVFTDPNARLPGSQMERLWSEGERLTADPNLGMHTAESYNPGALNILGYVVMSCRTAEEVLDRLSRYAAILNDGLRVRLLQQDDSTNCLLDTLADRENFVIRSPRQVMECMAAGIVTTLKRLTNSQLAPLAIDFRHPQPADITEHLRILGPNVRFSQPENRFEYRTEDLSAALLSSNPELLAFFEQQAKQLVNHIDPRGPVSRRVLEVLADRVKGTAPSLDEVAAHLATSQRSLQRELKEENTSFRELVDVVRREIAVQQLAHPTNSAAEVGFLLGFSDPSAFTRAFRRWTGAPPAVYRSA